MPALRRTVRGLALSCHPVPALAVTVMGTVLAAAAGDTPTVVVLVLVAVLAGQLSIGWSNDLIDGVRDRAAGRRDKPFATGVVRRRPLVLALTVATVAMVPLSLGLGVLAGSMHLLGVAAGWLYNLGLKATLLSPVAYAVAFGAAPAVATLARPVPALPPWWVIAAGALLGVGAHFGNVLPDIDDDRRAGVRGAPQRLGLGGSAIVAALAVVAAAGLLLGLAGRPSVPAVGLAVLVAVLAGSVVASARRPAGLRWAFAATMIAAALCIAMLVLSGALRG